MTPSFYARLLLDSLGLGAMDVPWRDTRRAADLWAASGAMWLSGHAHGPPRPCAAPLAACAQGAWLALAAMAHGSLAPGFSAYRLLGERAAIAGLSRRGRVSAGGACHLLDTADGVLAVNLPREDDFELLPAWVEQPVSDLVGLSEVLESRTIRPLLERARLLGLAVAAMKAPRPRSSWFRATRWNARTQTRRSVPLVVDLSSLWAGPLCGQILGQTGARVIKVESSRRPDGARFGPRPLFDLLNADKESVALDFKCPVDLAKLRQLLLRADIVIEAARPRALEQLGLRAAEIVAARPGLVWLSITGYGRRLSTRDWVAYGDDAGVAAGLSWLTGGEQGDPVFCGDAIADPLTGLHAALLAFAAWQRGGGELLDISLHGVVAYCVSSGVAWGRQQDVVPCAEAAPEPQQPEARVPMMPAANLGADTGRILAELL